jgi:hypothetical protein
MNKGKVFVFLIIFSLSPFALLKKSFVAAFFVVVRNPFLGKNFEVQERDDPFHFVIFDYQKKTFENHRHYTR